MIKCGLVVNHSILKIVTISILDLPCVYEEYTPRSTPYFWNLAPDERFFSVTNFHTTSCYQINRLNYLIGLVLFYDEVTQIRSNIDTLYNFNFTFENAFSLFMAFEIPL